MNKLIGVMVYFWPMKINNNQHYESASLDARNNNMIRDFMITTAHNLLYILEQRSSWSTSRIRPSWPRSGLKLSPILTSPYEHASCCHALLGILLFIAMVQVSHLAPLLSGWLLTNIQVNITTTPHNTWYTCLYITLALLFILLSTHLPFFLTGCLYPILRVCYTYPCFSKVNRAQLLSNDH